MEQTGIAEISAALMSLIRDNMFGGKELALIEPVRGPRPGETHCTIGYVRSRPHQHVIKRWEKRDDGLYQVLRGTRYCMYRISFVGTGAYQKATDCQNWIRNVLGAEFILAPITGFGEVGEAQEATTGTLATQEERAYFNLSVYAKFGQEIKWDEVEHVVGDLQRDRKEDVPYRIDKG